MKIELKVVPYTSPKNGVTYNNLVIVVGDSTYPISVKQGKFDAYQVNNLLVQLVESETVTHD